MQVEQPGYASHWTGVLVVEDVVEFMRDARQNLVDFPNGVTGT